MVEAFEELGNELGRFRHSPETLLPDLVLHGFAADVHESAAAVACLAASPTPHKAYSNARLAFEGAQNALVLATHERYDWAGALAWAYFDWRDREWRAQLSNEMQSTMLTGDEWLDARTAEMASIWSNVASGRGALLLEALTTVRQQANTKPDNWLRENMTARQDRAYQVIGSRRGGEFDAGMASLNRQIYSALCRETHARPRLDAFVIRHQRDVGEISVDIQPRDLDKARNAVIRGTELSIVETTQALRWRRRVRAGHDEP